MSARCCLRRVRTLSCSYIRGGDGGGGGGGGGGDRPTFLPSDGMAARGLGHRFFRCRNCFSARSDSVFVYFSAPDTGGYTVYITVQYNTVNVATHTVQCCRVYHTLPVYDQLRHPGTLIYLTRVSIPNTLMYVLMTQPQPANLARACEDGGVKGRGTERWHRSVAGSGAGKRAPSPGGRLQRGQAADVWRYLAQREVGRRRGHPGGRSGCAADKLLRSKAPQIHSRGGKCSCTTSTWQWTTRRHCAYGSVIYAGTRSPWTNPRRHRGH